MVQSATYNETGLTYDQHCFYYNGGYDNVCLLLGYGSKKIIGGGREATETTLSVVDDVKWINITVSSRLLSVNKDDTLRTLEEENTQHGKGHLAPGSFTVLGTSVKSLSPVVRYVVKSTTTQNLLEKILIKAEHLTGSNPPQSKKKQ